MFINFNRLFNSIMEGKEEKYVIRSLRMNIESCMDFLKKISSLVILFDSIAFNDPIGMKKTYISWAC